MNNQKPQTYAEITPDMIQDWKAKHGVVKEISAKNKTTGIQYRFAAIKPSRTVMDLLGKHQTAKDTIAANKLMIANCIVGGDLEAMEADGFLYTEVLDKLRNLADDYETEIKNL